MSNTVHSHPMSASHSRKAFTLVELLVVIGVIALLVSILMPVLGKARQQANLVSCQANLRSIGQLFNIYASDNKGFLPYGFGGTGANNGGFLQSWNWPDTVSLVNQKDLATIQTPANGWWPPVEQQNMALDFPAIFHDSDLSGEPFAARAGSYNGNPRLLPDATAVDPVTNVNFKNRSFGSVQRAAEVMLVWDGSSIVAGGTNLGTGNYVDKTIDNSQWGWGHGFCYPAPAFSYYSTAQYDTPIAPGSGGAGPSSAWAGSVTPSVLTLENVDDWNNQWFNINGMRFRHLNNKAANALFVDGHVESRALGAVLARDICVNP